MSELAKHEMEISSKLDTLVRLMTLLLINGKTQREQLLLLSKTGFQPKDIADILQTTPNAVRVALSKLRKLRSSKRRG